ncbi:MAG: MBL fold metallo-hydrolase [Alphaproteobacteria bacterium]
MRPLKFFGALLGVLVALGAVALFGIYNWATAPLDLTPYQDAFNPGDIVPEGDVAVTYMGVSTLYITDGETNLMVDGFFSRPWALALALGKLGPDNAAIDLALAQAEITKLDAIFPVHSHYDHAMDTPWVAQKTGADILGGSSTAMIARGADFPENRMVVITPDTPYRYGRFEITFLLSKHAPLQGQSDIQGPITAPLVPPQRFTAWNVGEAWSILITHHGAQGPKTMLVQGSAGYVEDNLAGRKVDTVFLGIGGIGSLPQDYQSAYWDEFVVKPGAAKVYPIHWDDFTIPLTQPLQGQAAAFFGVAQSLDHIMAKRAAPGAPKVELLQSFVTVAPFN